MIWRGSSQHLRQKTYVVTVASCVFKDKTNN